MLIISKINFPGLYAYGPVPMVMIDLSKNEYHHMQNYLIYIGVDNMATLFSVSDHIANLKLHFGSNLKL